MQRKDLRELTGNPNFISGIYNYCDRWCERCQFTSRCLLYATEQADPDLDDPEVRDLTNEKFWRKLGQIFAETAEMISEWAAEAGVDLDAVDATDDINEHERDVEAAEQNELGTAARNYAMSVEGWFKREFADQERLYDDSVKGSGSQDVDLTIRDAVDVIRWYQFFIAAKTFRALTGLRHVEAAPAEGEELFGVDWLDDYQDSEEEAIDFEEIEAMTSRMDANGSAKIALIGMDRSMSAWRALQLALPEKAESIKPLLMELEKLRRGVEQTFLNARDFIRPGFDEVGSEFVS